MIPELFICAQALTIVMLTIIGVFYLTSGNPMGLIILLIIAMVLSGEMVREEL